MSEFAEKTSKVGPKTSKIAKKTSELAEKTSKIGPKNVKNSRIKRQKWETLQCLLICETDSLFLFTYKKFWENFQVSISTRSHAFVLKGN